MCKQLTLTHLQWFRHFTIFRSRMEIPPASIDAVCIYIRYKPICLYMYTKNERDLYVEYYLRSTEREGHHQIPNTVISGHHVYDHMRRSWHLPLHDFIFARYGLWPGLPWYFACIPTSHIYASGICGRHHRHRHQHHSRRTSVRWCRKRTKLRMCVPD